MPSSIRPPESWSIVAAVIAVIAAERPGIWKIAEPSLIRSVGLREPGEDRRGVGAVGLSGPDRVVAEPLGLQHELELLLRGHARGPSNRCAGRVARFLSLLAAAAGRRLRWPRAEGARPYQPVANRNRLPAGPDPRGDARGDPAARRSSSAPTPTAAAASARCSPRTATAAARASSPSPAHGTRSRAPRRSGARPSARCARSRTCSSPHSRRRSETDLGAAIAEYRARAASRGIIARRRLKPQDEAHARAQAAERVVADRVVGLDIAGSNWVPAPAWMTLRAPRGSRPPGGRAGRWSARRACRRSRTPAPRAGSARP